MHRKIRQLFFPVLIFALAITTLCSLAIVGVNRYYQAEINQEYASLLGVVASQAPTVEMSKLIQSLRYPSTETQQIGMKILRDYGYRPQDSVSEPTQDYLKTTLLVVAGGLTIFAVVTVLYFWWLDYCRQRQIRQLVDYLEELNSQTHDLKLAENREGEFSLLTNQLYKLIITQRTVAHTNQEDRQKLETALADISHQLRTPLTSLQITVDNLVADPAMPVSQRQEFLNSTSRQLEQMSSLVTTLLHLTKFDNHSIKLASQRLVVGELLNTVIQNLAVLAELNDLELILQGDLQVEVRLDARWQTEALTNIIKNCLEHSPRGEKIIITIKDCPLFLKIIIEDHGEGIAPSDLRHIFERFYSIKSSRHAGVGIGLAFAKAIIEAENGQIAVQSTPGKGTKFSITYFK